MGHAHEAGFDSFTTAKVLIRLSAKLEAAGYYIDSEEEVWHTPPENLGVLLNYAIESHSGVSSTPHPSIHQGIPLSEVTNLAPAAAGMLQSKKAKKPKKEVKKMKSAFAHTGMFDLLREINEEEGAMDYEDLGPEDEEPPAAMAAPQDNQWNPPPPPVPRPLGDGDHKVSRYMPSWDSDFWNVYGNKLRVNGTVEGICDLMSGAPRR